MADVVTINVAGFNRLADALARGSEPIKQCFRLWAEFYRSAMKERFNALSRGGGGEWPDLAESTKRGRRKARKGYKGTTRTFSILRDTNTLFRVLTPTFSNAPGAIQTELPNGITVGFGGPARHPKGKATIADIARFHHEGLGHLPVRKLLVPPPPATQEKMRRSMEKALTQAIDQTRIS